MSTLNEFISQVNNGGLMTTNRFSVEFSLPPVIQMFPNLQNILLHCETASIPGINISTTQAKTFGEFREMPYERTFEPVQIVFYVDNAMTVKMLFDTWAGNSIQNMTTRKFNYYKDYTTNMFINVYDKADNQRYRVMLFEAYPKNVASIQLDNNFKGEPMRVIVSMNYKYWDSSVMDSPTVEDPINNYVGTQAVPDTYYTNFNAYQAGYNSFENARNSLYSSETQSIGLGSIFN